MTGTNLDIANTFSTDKIYKNKIGIEYMSRKEISNASTLAIKALGIF